MKKLIDQVLDEIKKFIEKKYNGNMTVAARELNVNYQTLYKWLNKERKPKFEYLEPILEIMGTTISFADKEPSKEVCFVDAKIVNAENCGEKPEAEDYLAVPLVEEVGAGPGIIPQGELLSWFLVYKHQPAVLNKTNLIAVQISKKSNSMEPTLHPNDIVLIDRSNKDVTVSGRMFLVLDPDDGSGKIKRVAIKKDGKDFKITYYSDNARDYAPETYSLEKDFFGDWNRCIVGKVIWAWSDVSEK